jgi:hypothetical protein
MTAQVTELVSMASVLVHAYWNHLHVEPMHFVEYLNTDQFACAQMVLEVSQVVAAHNWNVHMTLTVNQTSAVLTGNARTHVWSLELVGLMLSVELSTNWLNAHVLQDTTEIQLLNASKVQITYFLLLNYVKQYNFTLKFKIMCFIKFFLL